MSNGYVVVYVRGKDESEDAREVLDSFRKYHIKFKVVDLKEKTELYGHSVSLEGAFAIDFSRKGLKGVPITPLVSANGKIFSGSREIIKNIGFFKTCYSGL